MEGTKDLSRLLDIEKQAYFASCPRFRIGEFTISPTQKVPWHCHAIVQDTYYILVGQIRLFLRDPEEEVRLAPGETYSVRPRRLHFCYQRWRDRSDFLSSAFRLIRLRVTHISLG
jgi:hypothetical protein